MIAMEEGDNQFYVGSSEDSLPVAASSSESYEQLLLPSHPYIKLLNMHSTAMSAKFRCLVVDGCDIWFDDSNGGIPQGTLKLGQESTTNTYEGHVFFATKKDDKDAVLATFEMLKDKVLYPILEKDHPPPRKLWKLHQKEEAFMLDYYERTGILWRHYYGPNGPRAPPILYMWPAEEIGQTHHVQSFASYW